MDWDQITALATAARPLAAPVSDERADRLLGMLGSATRVVDLGCGPGEWVARLVERTGAEGVGVDPSPYALDRARLRSDRVRWVPSPLPAFVAACDERFDVALCVGSSEALGGLNPALASLQRLLDPGGLALVGEQFWSVPPGAVAEAAVGDLLDGPETVDATIDAGFTPLVVELADQQEWDDYERAWAEGVLAAGLPALATERWSTYQDTYRGALGFTLMVLEAP